MFLHTFPAELLHQAVHHHQEVLDAWALCGGDIFEIMGTKVGSGQVSDDTEAKC
jgi:hypothetical protein